MNRGRHGYIGLMFMISASLGLLFAVAATAEAAERIRKVAPVKRAPAKIQRVAPAIQKPGELDIRPDLTLGTCEVLCSKGGGYSTQLCQQEGYSDKFTYRVQVAIRNTGKSPASIEAGWRIWSATHQAGGGSAVPIGWSQTQQAPAGGLYLTEGAYVPGTNAAVIQNLQNVSLGTNRVVFTADPENHLAEKNETNNVSECAWTVVEGQAAAPYDLTITHVSVSPSSGPPGTNFKFSVTVKNVGGDTYFGFNTSCQPGTGFNTPGLQANQTVSRTLSIPGTLTPGTKTIVCDVDSQQPEQNTSNNTMSATFTVTPP